MPSLSQGPNVPLVQCREMDRLDDYGARVMKRVFNGLTETDELRPRGFVYKHVHFRSDWRHFERARPFKSR